jgi:cation transport ATPase
MTEQTSPQVATRLWIGAYLVATFGTAALARTGVVPGWPGVALFLASFLLLYPLMRSVERAQSARGCASKAMRTYNRRVMIASTAYVAALLAGVGIARYYDPPAMVRIILAIVVALPVIFMIRAMALLLRDETDEYLRSRIVEQSLIATGILLTAATLYGFLNTFDLAPRVDSWAAVPLWALGLGIGRLFRKDPSC